MRRKKLHFSVVPVNNTEFCIKSQYEDYIREYTPNGKFQYSIYKRSEDFLTVVCNSINSGILKVDFDNHNTIK
jgi:hypothetical protein